MAIDQSSDNKHMFIYASEAMLLDELQCLYQPTRIGVRLPVSASLKKHGVVRKVPDRVLASPTDSAMSLTPITSYGQGQPF